MKRVTFFFAYLTVGVVAAFAQPFTSRPDSVSHPVRTFPPDVFSPMANEPFFPGGWSALQNWLETTIAYPPEAWAYGVEGTVRVRFRVQPSGLLTDFRVVKPHSPLLDAAALRIVALMPRWFPAHRAGQAVSRFVELPVTFRMNVAEYPATDQGLE